MGGYVGVKTTYTPIEYIESTGTQVINTGYTPLAHDKIVVDCLVKLNDKISYEALFGSRDGSYRYNAYIFFTRFNASNVPTYNRSGAETQGSNMIYNERITLTTQDSVATWTNGTNTYTCTTSGTVEDCVYPLYVFDLNKGSQDGSLSHVKLYSLKIYDGNDNLVRDFIPVLDSDGVAGLWDKVEERAYYNQGTGEFLYPAANTNDYDVLDYIESSGTQYLDIGFYADNNTRVIAEAMPTGISGGESWQALFSSKTNFQSNEYVVQIDKSAMKWYTAFGTPNSEFTTVVNDYNYYIDKNKNVTTINGATSTLTNSTFTSTQPMYIFADNESGPTHYFRGRLFWLKVYDDGTLVRHLVPAKRKSDDEICMYDLVNNQFYTNAGTGTFTGGAVVGTRGTPIVLDLARKLRKGYVGVNGVARKIKKGYVGVNTTLYTPLDYIESSGTQYIDTGIVPKSTTRMVYDVAMLDTSNTYRDGWGSTGSAEAFFCGTHANNSYFYASVSNNWGGTDTTVPKDTTRHTWDISNAAIKFDNVSYGTGNIGDTATTGQTLYIGAFHVEYNPYIYYNKEKIYGCQIYDGNTLVRDFIPVLDPSNVVCLLEQVENKFYYNAGSGTFAYGTTGTPVTQDVARKIFSAGVSYNTTITNTEQIYNPMVTNTDDYVLVAGGVKTNGGDPVKKVTAYNSSLVATAAADMSYQAHMGTATYFNGYGIVAGGKTAWSGGSGRSSRCMAFSNSLTRTDLSTIYQSVFEPSSAANSTHFIIEGGCYYNGDSNYADSYSSSFVRTNLSNMSGTRRSNSAAAVGNYIVCIGSGLSTNIATDFYDNSNVKTTGTSAYSKYNWNPLGLSTDSYAIFFGGSTSQGNGSYAYKDCRAYDSNKVLTSFELPSAVTGAGGLSDTDYAMCCLGSSAYIYDENLMLQETLSGTFGGITYTTSGAKTDSFGMVHLENTSNINVFDV